MGMTFPPESGPKKVLRFGPLRLPPLLGQFW